jgi:hypothetical protein
MKIAAAAAPLFRIDANATTRIGAPLTLKRLRKPRSPPRGAVFCAVARVDRRKCVKTA